MLRRNVARVYFEAPRLPDRPRPSMHRSRYALSVLLIALCAGVLAAGCGRKGPLFLPDDAKTPPAADTTRGGETVKR